MEQVILTIILACLGSSGLWSIVSFSIQKKSTTKSTQSKMLLGLSYDRICLLCEKYLERGFITTEEYENLVDYLYKPYQELGGNGTAEKLINEVKKLPMKKGGSSYG